MNIIRKDRKMITSKMESFFHVVQKEIILNIVKLRHTLLKDQKVNAPFPYVIKILVEFQTVLVIFLNTKFWRTDFNKIWCICLFCIKVFHSKNLNVEINLVKSILFCYFAITVINLNTSNLVYLVQNKIMKL